MTKSGVQKTLKKASKTSKEAKKTSKEAQNPPKGGLRTSEVEQSTIKNTSVNSPGLEKRDGSNSENSLRNSGRDAEEAVASGSSPEDSNDDSDDSMTKGQRGRGLKDPYEASDDDLGNRVKQNLERARGGSPLFSSPETRRGLLGGPLTASRDTESQTSSSLDVEDRSNDQTRSGDRETPKQKSGKKKKNQIKDLGRGK
jgi:hypothetical protein